MDEGTDDFNSRPFFIAGTYNSVKNTFFSNNQIFLYFFSKKGKNPRFFHFFSILFGYMNYFLYLCSVKQKTLTTMAKKIVEEMLLTDVKVFGDDNEHAYNVTCEDGHATAVPTDEELEENPDAPKQLEMTYPKLANLSVYAKEDCLNYRGIYDMPYTSCDYSDVCMKYGEIKVK